MRRSVGHRLSRRLLSTDTSMLPNVKRKVVVLSGKGGVGKSTLAAQMAFKLASRGLRVGLLDLDICGPSIPHLLGLRGQRVGQSADQKMAPVRVAQGGLHLDVMSIGFLLDSEQEPVVLRGPRKDGVVKQFLSGVSWGSLDVLLVDTPPGTSDEHLSLVGSLSPLMSPADGAIVVSSPQAVSLVDVRKELNFCAKQSLRVLGVVENMAPLRLPIDQLQFYDGDNNDVTETTLATLRAHCPQLLHASQRNNGSAAAPLVGIDVFPSAEGGAEGMAKEFNVPFLGRVPLDPAITTASEMGGACVNSEALTVVARNLLEATDLIDGENGVHTASAAAPRKVAAQARGMHTRSFGGQRRGFSTDHHVRADEALFRSTTFSGTLEGQPPPQPRTSTATLQAAHTLFPTTIHISRLNPPSSLTDFNTNLITRAIAAYEQCWRSREAEATSLTSGLPGGWRTTANMLFFRQQLSYWREKSSGHGPTSQHIGPFQRSDDFAALIDGMRDAASNYLHAHGVIDAEEIAYTSPLFCWASIHLGGSVHPPHVHSDAAVTGTYYARRPDQAAPINFEDPRGRSPFDLVAGLEHQLRYGGGGGAGGGGGEAVPPFNRTVSVEPTPGDLVVFPPWLVHSVPSGPSNTKQASTSGDGLGSFADEDELLRVSFSFNLLGRWEHTARTRVD